MNAPPKGKVIPMSLRLPEDVHMQVALASARSNKSMNEWMVEIARAASASANAMYLVEAMEKRQLDNETVFREVCLYVLRLVTLAVDHADDEKGQVQEILNRLTHLVIDNTTAEEFRDGDREVA